MDSGTDGADLTVGGQDTNLDAAFSLYSRNASADWIIKAEAKRQDIVKRFPLDSWPTLPLDRYALVLQRGIKGSRLKATQDGG